MGVKDHQHHYDALTGSVANTVSRSNAVGDTSFSQVVVQSGKPILDSELNEIQEIQTFLRKVVQARVHPSGIIRRHPKHDPLSDYSFGLPSDPDYPINSFRLNVMEAMVAGSYVKIEYTNTTDDGKNLITLQTPTIYDGTSNTVKRTDFVFLEVFLALVAPSPRATGTIMVVAPLDGDTVTVNGTVLTAKNAPVAATDFLIGANDIATALNLATVISSQVAGVAGSYDGSSVVTVSSIAPGTAGNAITLATSGATFVISGPFLTGGASRPNKPAEDKLYRHGNTESPSGTWLDDYLADPVVVEETAQRVQVQYRFRTTGATEAINFKKHPDGFSNTPNQIMAQGSQGSPVATYPFVPADGVSVSSNSSAVAYGFKDSGLWIAGDGTATAATALGSVDGFVYAIPITLAFRHNDCSDAGAAIKGFDPINNANGGPTWNHGGYAGVLGAIPAGESDRPDAEFCNVVSATQIWDLRRHISLHDFDLMSEITYQFQNLLDGNLFTWAIDTASKQELGSGSGDVSTQPLICNEIGRLAAQGGVAPNSGDTFRGESIRNFDHIARRFADQPVVERCLVVFYPGDRPTAIAQGGPVAPGTENLGKYVVKAEDSGSPITTNTWYEGDQVHLDLTALDATTIGSIFAGLSPASSGGGLGSTNISAFFPPGTIISDVLSVRHDDGNFVGAVSQDVEVALISGLGTNYLILTLDANPTLMTGGINVAAYKAVGDAIPGPDTASPRAIFLEIEVTYPIGVGLTDTPDLPVSPNSATIWPYGPVVVNDATQTPADLETIPAPSFREGFREVCLEYVSSSDGANTAWTDNVVSSDQTTLRLPRRPYGNASFPVTVTDTPAVLARTVDVALTEYGSSSRVVKLSQNLSGAQTLCAVTYYAQDPIPNYGPSGGGYQLSVYFRSNSPQTIGTKEGSILSTGDGLLPPTLKVIPLLVNPALWSGQVGMGSESLPYPYVAPLDQIPINDGGADTTKEWFFAASSRISVSDFDADSGILSLHPMIPADETQEWSIGGPTGPENPKKDGEFRAYYPVISTDTYRPALFTQPLSFPTRHKVFVPVLAKVAETTTGAQGGVWLRKDEVILLVISRFASLDDDNTVRFVDSNNTAAISIYKTKGLLVSTGEGV